MSRCQSRGEIHEDCAVQVQGDHLANLARARSPIAAVTELVWNGLDADATEVRVSLIPALPGGLQAVRVSDNGHGLAYEDAIPVFRILAAPGNVVKTEPSRGTSARSIRKGRFRAFALAAMSSGHAFQV